MQGWAFDFDNPDAGTGSLRAEEDAILKQVMNESLRDSKLAEADKLRNPEEETKTI